jgi:hypothetical protein
MRITSGKRTSGALPGGHSLDYVSGRAEAEAGVAGVVSGIEVVYFWLWLRDLDALERRSERRSSRRAMFGSKEFEGEGK